MGSEREELRGPVVHTIPIPQGLDVRSSWEHIREGLWDEVKERPNDGWGNILIKEDGSEHVIMTDYSQIPLQEFESISITTHETQADAVYEAIEQISEDDDEGGNVMVSRDDNAFDAADGEVRVWYHLDENLVDWMRAFTASDGLDDALEMIRSRAS